LQTKFFNTLQKLRYRKGERASHLLGRIRAARHFKKKNVAPRRMAGKRGIPWEPKIEVEDIAENVQLQEKGSARARSKGKKSSIKGKGDGGNPRRQVLSMGLLVRK